MAGRAWAICRAAAALGLLIDRRGGSERAADLTMPPPHTWNTRLNQCRAIFAPSSDSAACAASQKSVARKDRVIMWLS